MLALWCLQESIEPALYYETAVDGMNMYTYEARTAVTVRRHDYAIVAPATCIYFVCTPCVPYAWLDAFVVLQFTLY